jgi:hypothetical protein
MILDINLFTQAIQLLQTSTLTDISNSLEALNSHHDLAEEDYNANMAELRRLLIIYKKQEAQINYQKQDISTNNIGPWIPILKMQQAASSVYPDVRAKTVSNILDSKREIDSLDATLEEMKLRLLAQGKNTKSVSDALQQLETKTFVLQTAIDIVGQFNAMDYDVKEIADYQISKYFDIYRKGS